LVGGDITYKGAKALAEALKMNSTVTVLALAFNNIGDKGTAALAEGLKLNRTITYISLDHNNIGEEGAAALASIKDSIQSNNIFKLRKKALIVISLFWVWKILWFAYNQNYSYIMLLVDVLVVVLSCLIQWNIETSFLRE